MKTDSDPAASKNSFALVSPRVSFNPNLDEPPVNIGILASGSGSNFEAIAQAIAQKDLNARIQVMIYNNPGAKAAERADRFKVPSVLLNHREWSSREAFDAKLVETLQHYGVEWLIMAGWMRRVTEVLLSAFPQHVLNIHPSLLPSFPGVRAVEQALAAGVRVTGCTVHFAELEVDSGPIVMQAAVPILPTDDADSLHARIQVQEHYIYPRAIALAFAQAKLESIDG